MNISIFTAVSDAIEWTKHILFREFNFAKYITLGFCAFLAFLGESGFPNTNFSFGKHRDFQVVKQQIIEYLPVIIIVSIIIFIIIISLILLFSWLSSRGKFMFLDCVVHNRAAVVEPWQRFSTLGNSLFIFRLVFGLVSFVCVIACIGICIILLLPAFCFTTFTVYTVVVIILGVCIFFALIFILILFNAILNDFIIPIMYVRNVKILPALSLFARSVLPGRVMHFFLFYLVKFVFGIAIAVISITVICCTCCIALIPFVCTLVFLPIHVFQRAFPLFFLQQFSDDWRLIHPGSTESLQPIDTTEPQIV